MTIHWKAVEQYFTVCFSILSILENLSILDMVLSGVKGVIDKYIDRFFSKRVEANTLIFFSKRVSRKLNNGLGDLTGFDKV